MVAEQTVLTAAKTILAAAKTVLAAAILALGFSPPPEVQSSPFYFILDWSLEIVIVEKSKIYLGTLAHPPARFR